MGQLYPIYVELTGRRVVVIGGGKVAERKVEVLLAAGAAVRVISPEVTEKIAAWGREGKLEVEQRGYRGGDLAGAWLAVAACGERQVNEQVYAEAEAGRIFCNVVDEPEQCSFQAPAIVTRGALQIAVSTGGASPALAKRIRKELQKQFGEYYEGFLEALAELREHLKKKYADQERRAEVLEGFVNSEALELLREGKKAEFRELLKRWKENGEG